MADVFEFQSCCNEFQFTDPEDNFESWNGLRGPAGPAGPAGAPGTSVELRGPVASSGQLPATAPSSELWLVGTAAPYEGWFYNGTSWQNVGQIAVGPVGPAGPAGDPGSDGTTFMPSVSSAGVISWTNDGGKPNPDPVNIRGPKGEPGDASLTILSYGHSTWADFISAYQANSIVYCRASISADPSAGSQVRMAYMAYVNHPTVPTSVEFQYYRSMTSHSDDQQGDQIFIYTLTNTGAWTSSSRRAFTKIEAGTNMSSSYANGTLTLNATGGGGGTSDYTDLTNKPSINGTTLSGNKTAAELDLGTYSKPSGGIPQTDFASAVQSKLDKTVVVSDTQPTETENKLWVDTDAGAGTSYQVPTVAEMEAADAQTAAEIGIVITGKRPSMAVTAGQFVIVRNSTISGIADGLYTANAALSPSTDVAAADLTSVSEGGLNNLVTAISMRPTPLQAFDNNYSRVQKLGRSAICAIDFQAGNFVADTAGWYNIAQLTERYHPNGLAYSNYGFLTKSDNSMINRIVQIEANGLIRANVLAGTYTKLFVQIAYFTN